MGLAIVYFRHADGFVNLPGRRSVSILLDTPLPLLGAMDVSMIRAGASVCACLHNHKCQIRIQPGSLLCMMVRLLKEHL
jgi:hypothetical protein